MLILFINHKRQQCGVYQYGLRLYTILKCMENVQHEYVEIDCYAEYTELLTKHKNVSAIIYNYHFSTMNWLNSQVIQRNVRNIFIPHDSQVDFADITIEIDPTRANQINKYTIQRPIFENISSMLVNYIPSTDLIKQFIELKKDDYYTFGSFGFGFYNKGFDKVVKLVNDQYDKAIIKLVIPTAHFGGPYYDNMRSDILNRCQSFVSKPNIHIVVSFEFFTNNDLLYFLNSNTANLFMYDKCENRSISSVIDYAISVNTPIGISDSLMFQHIYNDDICLYNVSIDECIRNNSKFRDNIEYMQHFDNTKLIDTFLQVYNDNISPLNI
jgi:hypothetical protein